MRFFVHLHLRDRARSAWLLSQPPRAYPGLRNPPGCGPRGRASRMRSSQHRTGPPPLGPTTRTICEPCVCRARTIRAPIQSASTHRPRTKRAPRAHHLSCSAHHVLPFSAPSKHHVRIVWASCMHHAQPLARLFSALKLPLVASATFWRLRAPRCPHPNPTDRPHRASLTASTAHFTL